jgi:predicted PurR-regulated permease PerM
MMRYVKAAVTFVVAVFIVLFCLAIWLLLPELADGLGMLYGSGNKAEGRVVTPAAWTVRRPRRKCGQALRIYATRLKLSGVPTLSSRE